MKQPMDRQPPRRDLGDVRGRDAERASDYFNFAAYPEKADLKVKRAELLFWLDRQARVERDRKWYRRFWVWLTAKPGSRTPKVGELSAETARRNDS